MSIFPPGYGHWAGAAFFAGVAVYIAVNGRYALNARCAWAGLRVAAGDGSSDDERIEAAVKRRQAAEGPGVPLVTALTFSRLRNSQPVRAALLAVRTPDSVIPAYWFAASAISALLVLSFAIVPGYALPAIAVCLSSLTTIYLAWRMTLLPALLTGADVPAEQVVDDRLRFNRSTVCMFYGVFLTAMFGIQFHGPDVLQIIALSVSFCCAAVFWVWITLWRYRAVRLA